MKCPNCGGENPDSVVYCQKCSHQLADQVDELAIEPKFPTLWVLGLSMCIAGIILEALYMTKAVTGLFAGPMLVVGAALFLAGLITWRKFHEED